MRCPQRLSYGESSLHGCVCIRVCLSISFCCCCLSCVCNSVCVSVCRYFGVCECAHACTCGARMSLYWHDHASASPATVFIVNEYMWSCLGGVPVARAHEYAMVINGGDRRRRRRRRGCGCAGVSLGGRACDKKTKDNRTIN